jgi:hypothetical protein
MVVNFDYKAIGPDCDASPSQRCDHIRTTGAVGWIYDYWQMRDATNRWHGSKIERVACVWRESANTSLAQNHAIIALGHDVLGREKPFLEGSRHPSL